MLNSQLEELKFIVNDTIVMRRPLMLEYIVVGGFFSFHHQEDDVVAFP